jgi:hypothetical protein
VFCFVDSQDFQFEEFVIAEAICLPFHRLNFGVGPFQTALSERILVCPCFQELKTRGNSGKSDYWSAAPLAHSKPKFVSEVPRPKRLTVAGSPVPVVASRVFGNLFRSFP